MKIAHIIDSEGFYGAEAVLLNIAAEQKECGLYPVVINMRRGLGKVMSLKQKAAILGIDIVEINACGGKEIVGCYKIVNYIKKIGVDVIHTHGYKANILMRLLKPFIGCVSTIATVHGWTGTGGLNKLAIYEWLDGLSLRGMDAIVVVSKKMLSINKITKIDKEKLYIVNNGIPVSNKIRENANKGNIKNELDPDIKYFCDKKYTIGAIGRLSKEKAYDKLIRAFKLLRKNGIDGRLVIIGEGSQRQYLEMLVENMNLKKYVFLPGYKNNAKDYLKLFDTFVISSHTEGFPVTLLEAMQNKIPIVATDVGEIGEVLERGKGGIVVEQGSVESITDAILKIYYEKEKAAKYVNHAYKLAISKYSSKTMAKEYLSIYRKILTMKKRKD